MTHPPLEFDEADMAKIQELNGHLDALGKVNLLHVNWVLHSSNTLDGRLEAARAFSPLNPDDEKPVLESRQ